MSEPPAAGRSDGEPLDQAIHSSRPCIDRPARAGLHGCQFDRVEAEQANGSRRDRRAEMVEGDRGGVGRRSSRRGDDRAEGDRLMRPAGRRRHRGDTDTRPDAAGRAEELTAEAATGRAQVRRHHAGGVLVVELAGDRRRDRRSGRRCTRRRRRRPVRWWRAVRAGSARASATSTTSPTATAASTPAE